METNFTQEPAPSQNDFVQAIVKALLYVLKMLLFLLACPFYFWKAATMRLSKANWSSLTSFVGVSRWPFLSFLKKILFEFIFDGVIFMSYFVGVIVAIYSFFKTISYSSDMAFLALLGVLAYTYVYPLIMSIVRDVVTLAILPFSKFLSWVSKPAQQIDVDFHNHDNK